MNLYIRVFFNSRRKIYFLLLLLSCFVFLVRPILFPRLAMLHSSRAAEKAVRAAKDPCNNVRNRIVHFDLKGAPPKVEYYRRLFPLLRRLNATAVLMEYEDMFPYNGDLLMLQRPDAYTMREIHQICKLARKNKLEVIPLLPTLDRMEFILKHKRFAHLRENSTEPVTICPSNPQSYDLIFELLRQIRDAHSKVGELTTIHIGALEALHVAEDERCRGRMNSASGRGALSLTLEHIAKVSRFAKEELNFDRVLVSHDLLSQISPSLLQSYQLHELIVPVISQHNPHSNATASNLMIKRFSALFRNVMLAGAFKGANGSDQNVVDMDRCISELHDQMTLCKSNGKDLSKKVNGVILNGRSRLRHKGALFELFPIGIPTLTSELLYLQTTPELNKDDLVDQTLKFLACDDLSHEPEFPMNALETPVGAFFKSCRFPGQNIYSELESLRSLEWNYREHSDVSRKEVAVERRKIRATLEPLLLQYFYKTDVTEWLSNNFYHWRSRNFK